MQCRPKADGKQMYTPNTKRCVSRDFFWRGGGVVEGGRDFLGGRVGEGESRGGDGGRGRSN